RCDRHGSVWTAQPGHPPMRELPHHHQPPNRRQPMTASTRSIVPDSLLPGAVSHAETDPEHLRARQSRTVQNAINRAADATYPAWLDHVRSAAGCTRPIRLAGTVHALDRATGQLVATTDTNGMPDGVIYKACGNRRASVCPSCSTVYQYDAYQLLRA